MAHSIQSPESLFDPLAQDYESMRKEVKWDPFVHIHAAFDGFDLTGLQILDAGCATGECTRWFQKQGARPLGIDISSEMCYQAAERSENIMYLTHDMQQPLPFDSERFDAVVALGCLEYLPNIQEVVHDFFRVLKKGGHFLGCFERYGRDCPGGESPQAVLFDDWMRYRQSRQELESLFSPRFSSVQIDKVHGFELEDTLEFTQYYRVIAHGLI